METKYTVSYAQNREDLILEGFFTGRKGKPGFYVDVGAGHPLIDSVTRRFYEASWHGINIDPINHIYKSLELHRERDINLNIGISDQEGTLQFREYAADGFSTFASEVQQQYVDKPSEFTKKYVDYDVKTQTLASVLAEHNVKEIQFLKIDVEGYEYEVIESNNWDKFRPEVICIEANHVKKDWRENLKQSHYKFIFFDGLNEYYVAEEKSGKINFSYVDAVINKEPILRYDAFDGFQAQQRIISDLKKHQESLEKQVDFLDNQLKEARREIDEMYKTRTYIKRRARRSLGKLRRDAKS